jgi:hypothetical protein
MSVKQKGMNDKFRRRFLLGELSEKEQAMCEEQYFSQDEFFEQLQAVETELVDEYVNEELSPTERARFEKRFLTSPEQRRRVEFARSFEPILRNPPTSEVPSPARGVVAAWRSWWTHLRRQPLAFQVSWAAVLALMFLSGSWFAVRFLQVRAELREVRAKQVMLEQQAAEQRMRIERLGAELDRERSRPEQAPEAARGAAPPSKTVSFLLAAGLVRDFTQLATLEIPPQIERVRLELVLEEHAFPRYQARLETASGDAVWRQAGMLARPTPSGKVVVLTLPAPRLQSGDYVVLLQGIPREGGSEPVNEYTFRVVHK